MRRYGANSILLRISAGEYNDLLESKEARNAMFKQKNNRTLFIILAVLAGIFILITFLNSGKANRNFPTDFGKLDTAAISTIYVYPKSEQHAEIKLTRTGTGWQITQGDRVAIANGGNLRRILADLVTIKLQKTVALSSDKWTDYEVTDSLATRIKIMEGNTESLYLLLGKTGFKQVVDEQDQQPNRVGISYARLAHEDEVYEVAGFLSQTFDRGFDTWRSSRLAIFNREKLTQLHFQYPAGSGFSLAKVASGWELDGSPANNKQVQVYFGGISTLNSTQFADEFIPPAQPDFQLNITGNNMSPASILGHIVDENYYVQVSLKPDTWVNDKSLFQRIFVEKERFLVN